MRTAIHTVVLSLLSIALLNGCGVSKEPFSDRPATALPDIPVKPKSVEPEGTLVLKTELLQISHANETVKANSFAVPTGAEKNPRVVKTFHLPIQHNGWLMLTELAQSFDNCGNGFVPPQITLANDANQIVEFALDKKVQIKENKIYSVKVVFENPALCTGIDVRFGVLFGE